MIQESQVSQEPDPSVSLQAVAKVQRVYLWPSRCLETRVAAGRIVNPQDYAADMIATMHACKGIGLAAPQVGWGIPMITLQPEVIDGDTIVVLYPTIQPVDPGDHVDDTEGCLSVPGCPVMVRRYKAIHLDGECLDGSKVSVTLQGFAARVIQHEVDHLAGVTIVERAKPTRAALLRAKLRRQPMNASWAPPGCGDPDDPSAQVRQAVSSKRKPYRRV